MVCKPVRRADADLQHRLLSASMSLLSCIPMGAHRPPLALLRASSWDVQVYIESILALQAKAGGSAQLPLAIMTSGDTHDRTAALLEHHAYFGMQPGQVTLLKQEKV